MTADAIERLPHAECRERLRRIREILWPEMEPDQQWSPDHIEMVAEILQDLRLRTVTCKLCGHEAHERQSRRHAGGWIGPCCWDDRLRATE